MTTTAIYYLGAELGDLGVNWYDSDGDIIDFSSGYTFAVKVGTPGQAALFTKTTGGTHGGATGAATLPNVTVPWATTGELNALTAPTTCAVQIVATRTADSKNRTMQGRLRIQKIIT